MVPIYAALSLFLITAQAAEISDDERAQYEAGFTAVQKSTRTFRADLRQTLFLSGTAKPIVSTGTLFYQTPDRLLLRFSQPAGEWLLIDGTRLLSQKRGQPVKSQESGGSGSRKSHAASLLDFFSSGAERWSKDFDVTMSRDGHRLRVELKPWLTPTSTPQGVERIVTTLKLPGYDILEIEVNVPGRNKIVYQFSNAQRNIPLAADLFTPPQK